MPSLELSMIVKNAEVTLARCLESVRGVVDEIVIGDTGSTDASRDVVRRYGARVIEVPWENDFALARNQVLNQGRAEWVLCLDADEMLGADAARLIPPLLSGGDRVAGYQVWIWNYVRKLTVRMWDQSARPNPRQLKAARDYPGYVPQQNMRLFRRHPEIYFEKPIHETVEERIAAAGLKTAEAGFIVHHLGIAEEDAESLRRKAELYRSICREKISRDPNDVQAHFEFGLEELERFGNPAGALQHFESVNTLCPEINRAWTLAGICLVRLGRAHEGLAKFKRAAELGAEGPVFWEARGDAFYHVEDFCTALECYQYAEESGGRSSTLESKSGICELHLGAPYHGIKRIQYAIKCEPQANELYDMLIAAALWTANPGLAAKAAERRLVAAQPTEDHFIKAASLRSQIGHRRTARGILLDGCKRFPSSIKLINAFTEFSQRNSRL